MLFQINYSPDAENHLLALTARQRVTVLDTVDEQLSHQPDVETRNRKPMRPNPLAPWELRVGDLRVYYDIKHEPARLVQVLAVGIKIRNTLVIGKEVMEL